MDHILDYVFNQLNNKLRLKDILCEINLKQSKQKFFVFQYKYIL